MFGAYQTIHRRFADRNRISLAMPAGRKSAVVGDGAVDGKVDGWFGGMVDANGRGGIAPPPSSARRFRAGRGVTGAGFAALLVMMGAALGAAPSDVSRDHMASQPVRLDPVVVTAPRDVAEFGANANGPAALDASVHGAAHHGTANLDAAHGGSAARDAGLRDVSTDIAAPMRIVVNLPAFRLDVLSGDQLVRSFPVTIGAHGYETPTGQYTIADIIFNPWWHPPQSDWAIGRSPVAPGPENPMGRAKLNFDDLLYIHGSSNLAALGDVGSHGCVRLANDDVIELARLVQAYGAPDAGAITESAIANPTSTRKLDLARTVALEIRYDVAEVREGRLVVYPDVYGLRRNLVAADIFAALVRAGVDLEDLAFAPVEEWAEAVGNGRMVTVPLDQVRDAGGLVAGLVSNLGF